MTITSNLDIYLVVNTMSSESRLQHPSERRPFAENGVHSTVDFGLRASDMLAWYPA